MRLMARRLIRALGAQLVVNGFNFVALRLIYPLLLLALVSSFFYVWVRLLVCWAARKTPEGNNAWPMKFPLAGVAILLALILSVGHLHHSAAVNGREKVLANLEGLSGSYKLRVNGQDVPNAGPILNALLQVDDIPAHHSHPTKSIEIEVEDEWKAFRLVLARDSERPAEYWVYYPKEDFTNGVTTGQEMGRITTSALDGY
jgi:hypothetical protein